MKKRKEMTLAKMSELTGFHVNSLAKISEFKKKNIMSMRLNTIVLLKEKLGVDMLKGIIDYSSWSEE